MQINSDILIVGTGHAGAQAAIGLRQKGFDGTLTLIGEEPDPPYERPPLSKDYLAGDKPFERLLIRPEAFWAERDIGRLQGRRVVEVDPERKVISCDTGEVLAYGTLIWAAGGQARQLTVDGHDLAGVFSVRNRQDIEHIKAALPKVKRVCVIGGGYIGLEAAAVLSKLGKQVTVIEAQDRVLARVTGETLSRFFEARHRAHGVDIRLKTQVTRLEGQGGQVTGVRLGSEELIAAEMVIAGIGIIPSVEPLLSAGAEGGNGVRVDAFCRTSLPDIYAIGDCAMHANRFADGALIRLESVQNANDQAQTAVKAIMGAPEVYGAVPWFWSEQYDLKLQTVGLSCGHDQAVLRGDPATRQFSVIYLKGGHVIALDCVNAPADFMHGRNLVMQRACLSSDDLADTAFSLKRSPVRT